MATYFWIAVGSAIGGMARYWCTMTAARLWASPFPWGTVAINILGSLVIGVAAALVDPEGGERLSPLARQFIMVGLCGGYTTFSSFSLQTAQLLHDGRTLDAGINIVLSVALCLGAVLAGHAIGRFFH